MQVRETKYSMWIVKLPYLYVWTSKLYNPQYTMMTVCSILKLCEKITFITIFVCACTQ